MTQMIIDGRQADAADGRTIDVVSPVDGKVFTTIPPRPTGRRERRRAGRTRRAGG